MQKYFNRGFTLIELLVVIAIIGILASVVLVSLNSARSRGSDAAVKANLSGARSQAELYYATNNNYTLVCTGANGIASSVAAATSTGGGGGCVNASGTWAAWATLPSEGGRWCVDSTGAARNIGSSTPTTVCP